MFADALTRQFERQTPCTIITPFGKATGKVEEIDLEQGTFRFRTLSPKPFRLYITDVLFMDEG